MTLQLGPGAKAPDFDLQVTTGGAVRLADALVASPGGVIVAFYPLAFTPG